MAATYRNIASVLRTHGSKGEVVAAPLRGLPLLLRRGLKVCPVPPALDRARFITIRDLNVQPDGTARVSFAGIRDLGAAEGLVGCGLLVQEDDVELGPMDVPFTRLIGRTVADERRGVLGEIAEVMETPANDVWVVSGGAYGEVLLPVIDEVVREIPEKGPIEVRALPGLIDDEDGR